LLVISRRANQFGQQVKHRFNRGAAVL